jgi:hypothetical protein
MDNLFSHPSGSSPVPDWNKITDTLDSYDSNVIALETALSCPSSSAGIRDWIKRLEHKPGGTREDAMHFYQAIVTVATCRLNLAIRSLFHDQRRDQPQGTSKWWEDNLYLEIVSILLVRMAT